MNEREERMVEYESEECTPKDKAKNETLLTSIAVVILLALATIGIVKERYASTVTKISKLIFITLTSILFITIKYFLTKMNEEDKQKYEKNRQAARNMLFEDKFVEVTPKGDSKEILELKAESKFYATLREEQVYIIRKYNNKDEYEEYDIIDIEDFLDEYN